MPGSGGSYVYLREGFGRETFGRLMAFLFIWQFIFSGPLEIASGYIGFSRYLGYLVAGPGTDPAKLAIAAAVGLVEHRLALPADHLDRPNHREPLDRHAAATVVAVIVTGA